MNYSQMTHIAAAFVLVQVTNNQVVLDTTFFLGTQAAGEALVKDLFTKAHAAGIKTLLSIGGGDNNSGAALFQIMGTSGAGSLQAQLVTGLFALASRVGADGFDLVRNGVSQIPLSS